MATVVTSENFNPEEDATKLREAMQKIKIDDNEIIDIITKRSNVQRQSIREYYRLLFGKNLVADLTSALNFNFKDVVVALLTKPRYYDVECLNDAIDGLGTNEETLIEILVSRTPDEIRQINQIYSVLQERSLTEDIKGDTSRYFKRLLVSLNTGKRDSSTNVDPMKAKKDAERLHEAGKKGCKGDTFLMILGSQSFAQLRATFNIYSKIYEEDITILIKKSFSGDSKRGFLAVVKAARNLPKYFARGLYKSMKGLGTDDKRLIRIIVSRSEVDMKDIKAEFLSEYKKSLESFIHDDTSGSYRKALLALISD